MAKTKQVTKKEPTTWAEFLAAEWDQWRCHHHSDCPPTVNYRYQVGNKVCYGNMQDAQVEEILEDGKLLVISYADRGESYGRPYDNNRRLPRICWWNDVDPISTIEDTHFNTPRKETHYTQSSLDSLVHQAYRRGLIDSPEYQRDYVWTLEDKQRLVKSIFDRADIGKFVLMQHPFPENRLEVIDGKQRLRAIMDFIEGRFAYEGKTWFQLSHNDKRSFFDIMVQVCQLEADRVKKSDVLWLFLSINRGGVPQTEEQVAKVKALYEQSIKEEASL
jgi:Protein of unknown function DUF262